MSKEKKISITSSEEISPDEVWKWGKDRETPIKDLDIKSAFKAALHCMKKSLQYSNRVEYFKYRKKIAYDEKQLEKAEKNLQKVSDLAQFFEDKLNVLSIRTEQLGYKMPSTFEGVKDILTELDSVEDEISS